MKYKKKPVSILALQYFGENLRDIVEFVGKDAVVKDNELYIRTLEGDMKVSERDFVIQGVQGEYYPCKEDIFWKTYEVEE